MFKHESQRAAFRNFLNPGPKDALDLLFINCALIAGIIEEMLAADDVQHEQTLTSALKLLSPLMRIINGVKFYDFMAESRIDRISYKWLRKVPKPDKMKVEAHLHPGMGVVGILVEFSQCEIPGFETLKGLGADSIELSAALLRLSQKRQKEVDSLGFGSDSDDTVIEGAVISASTSTPTWPNSGPDGADASIDPALGCRTYRTGGRMAADPPIRIVDAKA